LVLRFQQAVTFDVDGTNWSAPCAVVECLDEALLPTFVSLASDVATTIGPGAEAVTSDQIIRALASWELLLRSRALLSDEEQLGLWGELFFILGAPSVDGALRAWSPGKRDVLDFVSAGVGVEMKSGAVRLRHSLSYHQIRSGGGALALYFASLWVLPDAGGRTLVQMVDAVHSVCSELVLLEQKLLNCGFSRANSDVYSRRFSAAGPVVLFSVQDVPHIREFDVGVSSIRYTVELDPARALSEDVTGTVLRALCDAKG
jgi:hypothetical protein